MTKKSSRVYIPKNVSEAVLRDFHHRCAICGRDRPHLHHIDEDPSNSNDPLNILPLCPNHHLQDQHDPTAPIDRHKLKLFRIHRDPMILHERFHPLWLRCRFLFDIDELPFDILAAAAEELAEFVLQFEIGKFYSGRLRDLLDVRSLLDLPFTSLRSITAFSKRWKNKNAIKYRTLLKANQETALGLIVEMLRYQNWPMREEKPTR